MATGKKSGSGGGKASIRCVVHCLKHGSESTEWAGKQVIVSRPRNRTERKDGGCPMCNREAALAMREAS